ncbi:MAG: bacteriocin immunity protein [Pseudomonadota bacterium]
MQEKKEEFISLVKDLLDLDKNCDEQTEDDLVLKINRLSPDPEWTDYIFHSDEFVITVDEQNNKVEFDYIALAEKVFSYKPIAL